MRRRVDLCGRRRTAISSKARCPVTGNGRYKVRLCRYFANSVSQLFCDVEIAGGVHGNANRSAEHDRNRKAVLVIAYPGKIFDLFPEWIVGARQGRLRVKL